tara:strand:+ start:12343 stop:12552 length:210 start_codon:yes stop_codon:yes gene_type:complete
MAAITRLGSGGYGVKRAGSFAGKTQVLAISNPLDLGIKATLFRGPIVAKLSRGPMVAKLSRGPMVAKLS